MLKLIKNLSESATKLYGDNTVTMAKVLHFSLGAEENKEFYTKYKCNLEHLQIALLDHIREKEAVLVTSQDSQIDFPQQKMMESVRLTIEHALKNVSPDDIDNITFVNFFASMIEILQETDNTEMLYILQQSGFDFESFLGQDSNQDSVINELCTNLNEEAINGNIDHVIGRDKEILKVIEILGKRKKNNPVLTGKAGIGKTCIAEGLALKIVNGEVPHTIKNAVIYNLQIANMVAGTSFRGQFEEKMMKLLNEFEAIEKKGDVMPVLFIDEIHSIVGSGNSNGLDFSNIIKPALAKGLLRTLGATTSDEWQKFITDDKALKRRFSEVKVIEPTREETIEILKGAKKYYEAKHELKFTEESLVKAVDLSIKYITDSALPDKALDLIDYAGAVMRISKKKKVILEDIEFSLSKHRNISLENIRSVDLKEETSERLEKRLKESIFGQNHAIETVSKVIERHQAGLTLGDKPIGSFLFIGPTGVGKTELAKTIASEMKCHFERIDMSEFMEPHSVSKLIGAPPGYVGFDNGGSLTRTLEDNPHCVLLLDEMEKAHPKIQNILLQAMDNARVTDSKGNEISFKNVVIIMTSNIGARESRVRSVGLTKSNEVSKSNGRKELDNFFSPEFLGRLNSVVEFNSLGLEFMSSIVHKTISTLNEHVLNSKNIVLDLSKDAVKFIVEKGSNSAFGARPLEAFIKDNILEAITESILYGKIKDNLLSEKGTKVTVRIKNSKMSYSYRTVKSI